MVCAGGFRFFVEQGFLFLYLSLSLFLSLSPLPVQSYRGAARWRAWSQRTIKKSTKNKLRSARAPSFPPLPSLLPPPGRSSRDLPSLVRGSPPCHPRVATSRACVGANALSFRPFLSHSFSAVRLPRRLRGLTAARFSSLFFSWFVWGRSRRSRVRKTRERGEKSERGKNRVRAVCARARRGLQRRVASSTFFRP